jgi:5'-3' exonuclease
MGVPGFFSWLLRNYKKNKNIIIQELPENCKIDSLYLDANCLFHPQCFKVLGLVGKWKSVDRLEDKMMKRICNYIDFLIDFVEPQKQVVISVDGVAPMAKMAQQRKRRFRSMQDQELYSTIKQKHGKEVSSKWSNTVITPGTEFMEKLNKILIKYISKRKDILLIILLAKASIKF